MNIDKGISLPRAKRGRPPIYPFRKLEIGESFFVADITSPHLSAAACSIAKRTNRRFSTRAVIEKGIEGVRVWRIK